MSDSENIELYKDKLYVGNGRPPTTFQPSALGVLWIDYSIPTLYVCTNNSINNITWLHIDEKEIIEIRQLIAALDAKINAYNNRLNSVIRS